MKLYRIILVLITILFLTSIAIQANAQTSGRSMSTEEVGQDLRYFRKILFSDDNLNRYPILRFIDTVLAINGTWDLDVVYSASSYNETSGTVTSRAQFKFNSQTANPGSLQALFDMPRTRLTGISNFDINNSAMAMVIANPVDMMFWELDMAKNQLQAQKDLPMTKSEDIAQAVASIEQAQAMFQLVGGKEGIKRIIGNEMLIVLNDIDLPQNIDVSIILKINNKKELMSLLQLGAGAGLVFNWDGPEKFGYKFSRLPVPGNLPPVWLGVSDQWMVLTLNPNDFYSMIREKPYTTAPMADFYMTLNGEQLGNMLKPVLIKAEKEFEPYFPFADLRSGLKLDNFDFGSMNMMYTRHSNSITSIINYDRSLTNSLVYGLSISSAYIIKAIIQREIKIKVQQ